MISEIGCEGHGPKPNQCSLLYLSTALKIQSYEYNAIVLYVSWQQISRELIKNLESSYSLLKHFFLDCEGETSQRDIFLSFRRRCQYRRVQNRWLLFITLLNNPSLKELRRPEKFQHKSVFSTFNTIMTDAVGSVVDSTVRPALGKADNEHEEQHINIEV